MLVKKKFLLAVLLIPAFFAFSLALLKNYTLGDQIHYWRFYEALAGAEIREVMQLARSYVSSAEPIAAYLLWSGASVGVPKNVYISVLNCILLIGIFIYLGKHKSPWYIYLLAFSNFYLIVLLTGAERLKIAYMLIVYAAILPGRFRVILALSAPFAHLQSLILLISLAVSKTSGSLKASVKSRCLRKNELRYSFVVVLLAMCVFLYLKQPIIKKTFAYLFRGDGVSELFQVVILLVLALFLARDKLRMGLLMVPIMVAVFLLGGTRVNMIALTLFLHVVALERRLNHPIVVLLLGYLSLKSIFFIRNIFVYSNGFGGWLL